MKELQIGNKKVIIYAPLTISQKIPIVYFNSYDEDGEDIYNKIKSVCTADFLFVSISHIDWNREMSPWYMDRLFPKEEDYMGEADRYLKELENIIIPEVESLFSNMISERILVGYSLAGLFAFYSLFHTSLFSRIVCCSGSFWYPNFVEYVKNHSMNTLQSIYLSLGDKEKNSKNTLMSTVYDKTIEIKEYLDEKNILNTFELNEGGHFRDVNERIVKGIIWSLNKIGE